MKALLIGSTGLVGSELVKRLEGHPSITEVFSLVRREPSPELVKLCKKTQFLLTDFDRLSESHPCLSADLLITALGTTIYKAGSREAFRATDYEIPFKVARFARHKGATQCFVVSALGADPDSPFFYSRVKGELERDLRALHFPKLVIVRPAVLVGKREQIRPLESMAQVIGRFFPKPWRSISASNVAQSIVMSILGRGPGEHLIENRDLF
jgi:uncharacterized protein YbjT (DUF2867 family)